MKFWFPVGIARVKAKPYPELGQESGLGGVSAGLGSVKAKSLFWGGWISQVRLAGLSGLS
jgi:hypothetical protein